MSTYRILVVVRHPVGGIRTFIRYVYRKFASGNYQLTVVAPDVREARMLVDNLRELDVTYVPAERRASDWQLFCIVMRIIRTRRFDLIHSHGYTSSVCAALGAHVTRTPHILTSHDVFTKRQFVGFKGAAKKMALGTMLSTLDCIHCVGHDARANLLSYLPILKLFEGKIVVVPNGIEVERFLVAGQRDLRKELGLPPETFLIGFLGRFMSQKGFKYLVDAAAQMTERNDLPKRPVILTFGEDGFIREEKEAVRKRGLAEVIHFLPLIADVAKTLKGLDVVVMPSLWEACPLLPMEAMVAGVPVIGTSCVGLREVLEGTPARIVPPGDGVALAKALIMEMTNPTAEQARAFVSEAARRFEVRERAADLERLMLKVLEN